MRAKAGILLIISLLFLVGAVGALDASVINPPSKDWVIANVIDQSTITVSVQNTLGPINGATVFFSVNNSIYGTMSPATVTTGPSGLATSTFTVNKKSGTAIINANISYNDGGIPVFVTKTVSQNIDHSTPYYDFIKSPPLFTYPEQGTVASQVPFKVSILDEWGNSIDNRNPLYIHTIGLHVSSALDPNDCNFVGDDQDISLPLDSNGTLSVNVKLTSKSGTNKILMDTFEGKISPQPVWITAVANDKPYSMTGSITPGDGRVPANNIDKFMIDYYIYDKFGNPIGNRSIWVNTNLTGETTPALYTSDAGGLIRFYYGPKSSILTSKIYAVAYNNSSVNNELIVNFVSDEGTNMVLVLTPQSMVSRDVKPTEEAFVRATVIDDLGNPVQGESVTFSLGSESHGTYNLTVQPALDATTATTDVDGNAIVLLYPGSFAKSGEPGYNSAAEGSVDVIATWNGISKHVTATWKNFPYLSIVTSAEPPNVKVNDTIDITIAVMGNGPNMNGGNVAAMLDIDSSSSMWQNKDTPGPKRMDSAKTAANAFTTELMTPSPSTNWIGVDSFGYNKKENPFLLSPQNNIGLVQNKIANIVPGTSAQGMTDSITDSINNLTETQGDRPLDKIRAVVVLKDTANGGTSSVDPIPMENLAKSTTPKTMIFTVYYNDGTGTAAMKTYLGDIANNTGGKFFMAANSTELTQAFKDIAVILKTAAGVNATLNLNFQNIEVNSTPMVGSKVFTYIPVEPFYNLNWTIVSKDQVLGRTRIFWPNSSHSVVNQSDDWYDDYQLHFNIGTINISEQWNTTFRLKVNQTGLINIFNCTTSASTLLYNDGSVAQNVCLPNLYIFVNPNATTGAQTGELDVSNLVPKSGVFNDSVHMQWNLNYTGFDKITETYYYRIGNDPSWKEFGSTPNLPSTNGIDILRSRDLDLKKFPAGEYQIRVKATVPGIPPDEDLGAFTKPFENGTVSIQLK